ncbi:MAG: hypothetical protein AMXMBFR84_47910 [Candidatus Hydrogenedentota bacterium]
MNKLTSRDLFEGGEHGDSEGHVFSIVHEGKTIKVKCASLIALFSQDAVMN